jgi:hypothetical protein
MAPRRGWTTGVKTERTLGAAGFKTHSVLSQIRKMTNLKVFFKVIEQIGSGRILGTLFDKVVNEMVAEDPTLL